MSCICLSSTRFFTFITGHELTDRTEKKVEKLEREGGRSSVWSEQSW